MPISTLPYRKNPTMRMLVITTELDQAVERLRARAVALRAEADAIEHEADQLDALKTTMTNTIAQDEAIAATRG